MRWLALMALGALPACPADEPFRARDDAGVVAGEGIALHGRVVDFESCPIPPGCVPLEGIVVEVDGYGLASEPTGREGAFLIEEAPVGTALTLAVRGTAGDGGAHARTFSAQPVPASESDVFDLTLYALGRGAGTLLAALEDQAGIDLEQSGGYVGQVLTRIDPEDEGDRPCPDIDEGLCAVPDASASLVPRDYGSVEYVNGLPAFLQPGDPVLIDGADATTISGTFIVVPRLPAIDDIEVSVAHAELVLPVLTVPVEPGAVTLGFHRAN